MDWGLKLQGIHVIFAVHCSFNSANPGEVSCVLVIISITWHCLISMQFFWCKQLVMGVGEIVS